MPSARPRRARKAGPGGGHALESRKGATRVTLADPGAGRATGFLALAAEVLWPAVELAQRFVPLAPEPIQPWPSSGPEPAWIFQTGHLRPRPFCVSLCTSRQQPSESQMAALVFALKQILRHYRAAVGYAGRL